MLTQTTDLTNEASNEPLLAERPTELFELTLDQLAEVAGGGAITLLG